MCYVTLSLQRFLLQLVSTEAILDNSPALLNVVETNPFKHLTHLSLKLLPGNDVEIKKFLADCLKCSKVRFKFKLFFKNKSQRSLVIHWKAILLLDFIFWIKSFKRYPGNFYNTHRLYFIVLGTVLEDKTDQVLRNLGLRVFTNFLWPWVGHLSSWHRGFISSWICMEIFTLWAMLNEIKYMKVSWRLQSAL